jgi:hypothetical protein
LTYAQAAELTWPQLMHAQGISADAATDEEIAERIRAAQDEVFRQIATRRRWLAKDLLRVPAKDLIELVQAETAASAPVLTVLVDNLHRFVWASGLD